MTPPPSTSSWSSALLPSADSSLQPSTSKSAAALHGDAPFRTLSVSSSSSPSTSLAISPTGTLLYSASHSGIAVYDIPSLRQMGTFRPAAAGAVRAIAFSSDGLVFTAHQDSKIRVWRSESAGRRHRQMASLPTMGDWLRRFALPSNYVAVRRHRKRLWIEHVDAVTGLAVSGGLLFSISWDKTLKVWQAADFRCLQSLPAHDDAVNAIAVAGDGTVYTGSADGRIRVWRRTQVPEPRRRRRDEAYAHVATLEKHNSAVNALVLSPDGRVLCSGASDRAILIWEKEETAGDMSAAGAINGHQKAIMCLAYIGPLLVSGSTDRTVRVWRRKAGGDFSCVSVLAGHAGGVRTVAACRVAKTESESGEDEYRVFSGSSDGEVRVWQVRVGPL
ncbi:unnamed protein product [Spirodela intermedia]|uniref:Uncharacterized protein n=1 Tax=Spirodela intermedia TaxID=51605 RepID=A0A7I8KF90_SPIIN|nr:unnamed protein product [Spirodela intermedia]